MAEPRVCRLTPESTVFMQCDMQERARAKMWHMESAVDVAKLMAHTAHGHRIPLIVSEMMPEKIGPTISEITAAYDSPPALVYQKSSFSMCTEEVMKLLKGKKSVVLYGIEAHVCVQQTCLELISRGFNVHILVDAVTSKYPIARSAAIRRMERAGAALETYESVMTELDRDVANPKAPQLMQLAIRYKPKVLMPSL